MSQSASPVDGEKAKDPVEDGVNEVDQAPEGGAGGGRVPQSRHEDGALAGGSLTEVLGGLVGVLLKRGRAEMGKRAATGRVRLDLRMLRRDRDQMYQKLGREARALVEACEVEHPGLRRGVERIEELETRMAKVEAELRAAGQVVPESDTADEDETPLSSE